MEAQAKRGNANSTLKNLPWEILDELWDLKYPEDMEQKPMTLREIVAILPERYGRTLNKSQLGEFYQWLEVKRNMRTRDNLARQFMEDLAEKRPDLSPGEIRKRGQALFMAKGIVEDDSKLFAAMADLEGADYRAAQEDRKIELRKEANAIARDKLNAASRSKIDAGLDALYEEIKGNPKAVELFQQIKEIVRKA